MKALITGITGFVAKYLADYLIEQGYEVWGTTRQSSPVLFNNYKLKVVSLDLNSCDQITELINNVKPDLIFHLAGQSSVKNSWENKVWTFESNVIMTINLMEAIRSSTISKTVKILTIGSSEEYGDVKIDEMPINETTPVRPISPYGISKATVCMLSQHYYRSYSLNIIHARPFNHIGPGQSIGFVTTDFALQVAKIEAKEMDPIIKVGNLEAKRDFTDVRDIVKAYFLLVKFGEVGETYNICSSKPVKISYILDFFVNNSNINITIEKKDDLLRKIDFPVYIGSNGKLKASTNWESNISLESSLLDILNHCRKIVNKGSKNSE